MSALARLSTAAGGVIVLLAGSAMIASAHTASAPSQTPHAQTTTTAHQTTWEGNGSDNLPCTGGTLHWIFTGGDNGTFADLYINGLFADAGEQKGASGIGAWHFYTPSAGVTAGTNVYVTYDGAARGRLVISHCEEGTTTSTTSTVPTTSTTSTTETTSTSTVPTTSETTTTETTSTSTVPTSS